MSPEMIFGAILGAMIGTIVGGGIVALACVALSDFRDAYRNGE